MSNTTTQKKAAKAAAKWRAENIRRGYTSHLPATPAKRAAHEILMKEHFQRLPHYVLD